MTAQLARQARRTTIIFWVITALFVTQMGWWIYFQLKYGGEELAVAEEMLNRQPQLAADGWQRQIDRWSDSLRGAWQDFRVNTLRSSHTANLEGWSRMVFDGESGRQLIGIRRPDSLGTAGRVQVPIADGMVTILIQGTTVQKFLSRDFPGIRYVGADDTLNLSANVVTPATLQVDQSADEELIDRRRRRMRMFIAEGSFFIVLIIAGAVVIHRALRRTAEFEHRQQNFLAAVTHELKAPLASIRLFAETLASRDLPEAKRQECLGRISQDVERLHGLIDDILDAGIFSRRTFQSKLEESDLSAILKTVVEHHRPRAERARLAVREDIPAAVRVMVDESHMRRALEAIIDNAIKYSRTDGPRGEIDIALKSENGEAVITVADQGIGLDERDQKRVFERFFRAGDELTRNVNGSGLGLYLAREIIRTHKGKISLWSGGAGRGTTVEIRLPLKS